ncbi:MAG TPA: beta-ketoacyl-ACP synthase III [Elusimicrobiota bacterium]|nr:beta-ketoacyl-ACP synthase III [Elusimicrobiota bacterium]
MTGIKFLSTGVGLPENVLTNADLEKMVETSDQWITERTGIKTRRIASDKQATSDFSIAAARQALSRAGIAPETVDAVVVATCTPDHLMPSVACLVQRALGLKNAFAFDLEAACSGFIFGLACVNGLMRSGAAKTVLLIGADTLSKFTDWTDRGTCVLFGDGAGAALLQASDRDDNLLAVHLGSDGSFTDILNIPGGGSRHPLQRSKNAPFTTGEVAGNFPPYIHMEGKEIFKNAVLRMAEAADSALKKCGKTSDDLRLLIPHQANLRIIDAVAKRMKLGDDKVFRNVQKYGNMSAATTVIALDEAVQGGVVKRGDLVELIAFGGGLTWGAAVLRW